MKKSNYVYILRCSDGTFYTGWTTDLRVRLNTHNKGSGARYTRGRRPVSLVYYEELPNRSEALKREAAIKKLPRNKKLELIADINRNNLSMH